MSADNNPFKFTVLQKGTENINVTLLYEGQEVFKFSKREDLTTYLQQKVRSLMKMNVWVTAMMCGKRLSISTGDYGREYSSVRCYDTKMPSVSFYYEKLVKLLKHFNISIEEYKFNLGKSKQTTFYKFEDKSMGGLKRTAAGVIYRGKNDEQHASFEIQDILSSSFTAKHTTSGDNTEHYVTMFLSESKIILQCTTPKLEKAEKYLEDLEKHRIKLLKFYGVEQETLLEF